MDKSLLRRILQVYIAIRMFLMITFLWGMHIDYILACVICLFLPEDDVIPLCRRYIKGVGKNESEFGLASAIVTTIAIRASLYGIGLFAGAYWIFWQSFPNTDDYSLPIMMISAALAIKILIELNRIKKKEYHLSLPKE